MEPRAPSTRPPDDRGPTRGDLSTPVTVPPHSGRRSRFWLYGAVLGVVVVLVAALVFTNTIPGLQRPTSSNGPSDLTYFQALPLATRTADSERSGPWSLFQVTGVDTATPLTWLLGTGCYPVFTPQVDYLSSPDPLIAAYNGTYDSGTSPWWLFLYTNNTTGPDNESNLLAVAVVNGTGLAIATLTAGCYLGTSYSAPPSSGLVDSSAAMEGAVASNRTFFESHPRLNATMELLRLPTSYGGPPSVWIWAVDFTTCPLVIGVTNGTTTYPGVTYNILMNSTTGLVSNAVFGGPPVATSCGPV